MIMTHVFLIYTVFLWYIHNVLGGAGEMVLGVVGVLRNGVEKGRECEAAGQVGAGLASVSKYNFGIFSST